MKLTIDLKDDKELMEAIKAMSETNKFSWRKNAKILMRDGFMRMMDDLKKAKEEHDAKNKKEKEDGN